MSDDERLIELLLVDRESYVKNKARTKRIDAQLAGLGHSPGGK